MTPTASYAPRIASLAYTPQRTSTASPMPVYTSRGSATASPMAIAVPAMIAKTATLKPSGQISVDSAANGIMSFVVGAAMVAVGVAGGLALHSAISKRRR